MDRSSLPTKFKFCRKVNMDWMPSTKLVRRSGFSLIELLVVVTIIVILAALSIPQIQSSIKKGKQAQSMGNLRQIGTALATYISENDGYYPSLAGGSFGQPYWSQSVSPYLGASDRDKAAYIRAPDGYVSKVLLSPMVVKGLHHFWGDYGANQEIFRYSGNAAGTYTSGGNGPMSQASLSDPSRIVSVMEAQFLRNGAYAGSWYIETNVYVAKGTATTGEPSDRGTGLYLALFCDGHSEVIKKQDFTDNRKRYLLVNPQ